MAGDALKAALLERAKREMARRQSAPPQQPDMSTWGRIKDNVFGVNDGVTSFGEKLGTGLNMGGEAMTFGLVGDEAAAAADSAIGRGSYDERLNKYRGDEAQMWQDHPLASIGTQVLPALIPGAGAASAMMKMASVPGRMAVGGGLGALAGGTYGFMEGEGGVDSRLANAQNGAEISGLLGALLPGAGAAYRGIRNSAAMQKAAKAAARNAPSTEQLRDMGSRLYQQIDDLGVQIKPEAFSKAKDGLLERLRSGTGYDELPGAAGLTPKAARVMQTMDEAAAQMAQEPTAALPFRSLDQMRRRAGAAAGDFTNKADQQAGMEIIGGLDDFVKGLGTSDVVAGEVEALPGLIAKARDTWAKMSKSQKIDDAIEAADGYLSGQGSGLRYQFKRLLNNPKMSRGFSEAERKLMKRVVNGSIPEQLLRVAGSGLTQIGGTLGAGLSGGPLAGLAVLGASKGARAASDKLTSRNAEMVRRIIANGGIPNGSVPQLTGPNLLDMLMFSGANPATQ